MGIRALFYNPKNYPGLRDVGSMLSLCRNTSRERIESTKMIGAEDYDTAINEVDKSPHKIIAKLSTSVESMSHTVVSPLVMAMS